MNALGFKNYKREGMKRVLGVVCCLIVLQASAQNGKFEQLGSDMLPTPNSYRTATGSPGPKYWQQRADYTIDVEVNDETQVLTGKEKITYHNNSPQTLNYLWLQLDQNLFSKNSNYNKTKTGIIYDSIPVFYLSYSNIPLDDYEGGYTIRSVTSAGKPLPYIINNTMMRIDLPVPLKTGEHFSFSIEWNYKEYERMLFKDGRGGYEYFPEDGNYVYTFGQWYPRMCVYDDVEGWQNKQFLGQGEFALTFGNFKVNITVPSDHIVGATGWLQNPNEVLTKTQQERFEKAKRSFDKPVFIVTESEAKEKETEHATKKSTWTFEAENVRDFGFAHSRKFIWDAMAVHVGKKTPLAMSLYPKEGNPLWEKESTRAVKNTLEEYSARTIEYPYPVAYSVHTAEMGMEYPMICFNYGRPVKGKYSNTTRTNLIAVVVHEVGHNFFPMIVNSDERQWAWMDEGLNSFLEGETIRKFYPELNYTEGLPRTVVGYMRGDKTEMRPIMTSSDNIRDLELGYNAYYKPAAALTLLRQTIMGPKLFDIAFKEYAQRWAFKHPKPADFFRTMEDASAMDLDWFWRGWFYGTDHVDIAVEDVKWYKVKKETIDLENRGRKTKSKDVSSPKNQEQPFATGPTELSLKETPSSAYREFRNTLDEQSILKKLSGKNIYEVKLRNSGGLVSPVIIQWNYKDGTTETEMIPAEIWRKNESEVTKVFMKEKEILNVVIDPKEETGDVNRMNNYFPKRTASRFDMFKEENE